MPVRDFVTVEGKKMSVKNTKFKIEVPKYDVEGQLQFIQSVCTDMDFDIHVLIPLIFADWICAFQDGIQKCGDYRKCFIAYLESTKLTSKKLSKIKEYIENEENRK